MPLSGRPVSTSSPALNLGKAPISVYFTLQISFGPISWVMIGEIFPARVRGQAIAICTLINFGTNFAVSVSAALPFAVHAPCSGH